MAQLFPRYRCERCVDAAARCADCRARKSKEQRAERADRVQRGLCRYCAAAALPGKQECAKHYGYDPVACLPLPQTVEGLKDERARLHAEKFKNDHDVAKVREQLEYAERQGVDDPQWAARARMAIRKGGQQSQALQQRIGDVGRALRQMEHEARERDGSEERRFVNAARQILDRETYLKIWELARS